MKKINRITCWYCKTDKPNTTYQYNHYSEGWGRLEIPAAKEAAQQKAWNKLLWKKTHAYLKEGSTTLEHVPRELTNTDIQTYLNQ